MTRPSTQTDAGCPAVARGDDGLPIEGAAMIVAEAFTDDVTPLGIGGALALRGGDPATLARLQSDIASGWRPDLGGVLAMALHCAESGASPWLTVPPLLLCGPAGVGRTHVARRFAHLAGVPHVVMDLAGPDASGLIRHGANGPDLVLPSVPVLAMAVGRCANPVVTVTGIEELGPEGQRDIAAMIDPSTAGRRVDHAAKAMIDLRQVNWFVQCRDPHGFSPALLRLLHPVELSWPDDIDLHLVEVLAEVAIDRGVIDLVGDLVGDLLEHLRTAAQRRSTAEIYLRGQHLLDGHLADGPTGPPGGYDPDY